MFHDLRLALRRIRRRPLFALSVVLTLAIGLGANATIFSVVDSVLLRSLPYPDPDRLVAVWSTVQRDAGQPDSVERRGFSIPDLSDLATGSGELEQVAGFNNGSFRLGGRAGESPERIVGTIADSRYLRVLGVDPILGDHLSDDPAGEEGLPGVLLAHGLWQSRFGGDPGVVGETLVLDGDSVQIAGVLPPGFRGLVDASQVLFPLAAMPEGLRENRGSRWLQGVARLRDGATMESARSEMQTLFAALETEYASSNQGYGADGAPLAGELVGSVRSPLLLLWAAVLAVLIIASVNVINLLIVHLRQRAGDVAVRRALGASTWRLVRAFVAESIVLAALGSAVGLGLAVVTLRWLQPLAPVDLPGLFTVGLGLRALGFVLLLTAVVGLLVGAFAGLRSLGRRSAALQPSEGGDLRSTGRDPVGAGLLIAEVALATLLTISAGLLVRSFVTMSDVDPGMTRDNVGFLRLDWSEGREPADFPVARDGLLERVRSISGVEVAALARETPFEGRASATVMSPEGLAVAPDQPYSGAVRVYYHRVTPGYFDALDIPLQRGRAFREADVLPPDDDSSGPEAPGVAILSATLAERVFPGVDPIGERFYLGPPTETEEDAVRRPWFEVVGVAADHRHRDLIPDDGVPQDPDIFFAMRQFNPSAAALVVRSSLPTETLLSQIGRELRASDPSLLTFAPETLAGRLAQQTARPRFSGLLMTGFAALALVLAAVGIYGVVANQVLQRRREIGIRMALGADGARVLREVALPAIATLACGLAVGVIAALAAGRALEAQLFEISVRDPAVFVASALVLGLVALAAALLPARRASRLDPVEALRTE